MWKAVEELEALGLIGPERPRMVSVQSTETAPIVEAFQRDEEDTTPVEPGETIATGLNVADGIGHFRVLEILYESDGHAIAIPEAETSAALRRAYEEKGLWICPEGAACLAALNPLVDRDCIQGGDDVVVFNTGPWKSISRTPDTSCRRLLLGPGGSKALFGQRRS
jgi:threonine synthase